MEKPINIFEQFFDSLKHNPENCKIKEVKTFVVTQDHEKNDNVIVPTINDGKESVVVAENNIIEFKGEVVNDGGDVENTLDEVEEVNGTVLDVAEENASVPHELSITNPTLPSSFVFNVQSNVEFSKEEAFIIFPLIQKEFFEDELVPKASIPNLNTVKIRGRIFSEEGGNDIDPEGLFCATEEGQPYVIQMGLRGVQKHIFEVQKLLGRVQSLWRQIWRITSYIGLKAHNQAYGL
jgi:hypothetical protein